MWIVFYLIAFSAPFWSVFLMKILGNNDLTIIIAIIGAFFPSIGALVGFNEWLYEKLNNTNLADIVMKSMATILGMFFVAVSIFIMVSIW